MTARAEPVNSAPEIDVTALVLAAGQSKRMGEVNKLLAPLAKDCSVVRQTLSQVITSGVSRVLVVSGHQAKDLHVSLQGLRLEFVHNADYRSGMASSIACGVAALPPCTEAVMVLLADMPFVTDQDINLLLRAFWQSPRAPIVVPTHRGYRGNPVLWPRRYFHQLQSLSGDRGAKALLQKFAGEVEEVEMHTQSIFLDIDTPQSLYQAAQARGL